MRRRSILQSLLALPALFVAARAQNELSSRPDKWTCPYCKAEFQAKVLYANHRAVKFYTPRGEYETCTYAVGSSVIKTVNCKLVKETNPQSE